MFTVQLGSHTVQSHGFKVAKVHKHDWLILVLLMALVVILNVIHPFHRYVGQFMMNDLRYPHTASTVPGWAVPIISILLPLAIITVIYFFRRNVYDLHQAILGLLYSVLVTGVITGAMKDAVGRPRPDFFWRCFPDGKETYDQVNGNVICHGINRLLKDGYKSFPSGHTSWSFAGLGFLALYLSGKIRAFDQRGHVAKLCVVLCPILLASLIGISRINNYRHHWDDVLVGGLIGTIMAMICYLQFFPAPYHTDGWAPYAYLRMLEESGAASGDQRNVAVNQQPEGCSSSTGIPGTNGNKSAQDDLERGRWA